MKLFLFLLLLLGQAEALFKSRVAAPKVPAYKAAVSSSRFPRGKVVARSAQVIEEPFGQVAQAATDLTITALRLGTCALMAHHGLDKIQVRTHARSVSSHSRSARKEGCTSHFSRVCPTRRACTRTPSLTSLT